MHSSAKATRHGMHSSAKATRHGTDQSPNQAKKFKKCDDYESDTEDDTADESGDSNSCDGMEEVPRREPQDKKRKQKPIQPRQNSLKPCGIGDEESLAKILQHLKYHQTEITSVFAEGKSRTLMRASLHESLNSNEETSITKEQLDTHGLTDPIIIFERPLPHVAITDRKCLLIQIVNGPLPIYEWKIDMNELPSAMFDSIQPTWDNDMGMYVKGYSIDTSVAISKFKPEWLPQHSCTYFANTEDYVTMTTKQATSYHALFLMIRTMRAGHTFCPPTLSLTLNCIRTAEELGCEAEHIRNIVKSMFDYMHCNPMLFSWFLQPLNDENKAQLQLLTNVGSDHMYYENVFLLMGLAYSIHLSSKSANEIIRLSLPDAYYNIQSQSKVTTGRTFVLVMKKDGIPYGHATTASDCRGAVQVLRKLLTKMDGVVFVHITVISTACKEISNRMAQDLIYTDKGFHQHCAIRISLTQIMPSTDNPASSRSELCDRISHALTKLRIRTRDQKGETAHVHFKLGINASTYQPRKDKPKKAQHLILTSHGEAPNKTKKMQFPGIELRVAFPVQKCLYGSFYSDTDVLDIATDPAYDSFSMILYGIPTRDSMVIDWLDVFESLRRRYTDPSLSDPQQKEQMMKTGNIVNWDKCLLFLTEDLGVVKNANTQSYVHVSTRMNLLCSSDKTAGRYPFESYSVPSSDVSYPRIHGRAGFGSNDSHSRSTSKKVQELLVTPFPFTTKGCTAFHKGPFQSALTFKNSVENPSLRATDVVLSEDLSQAYYRDGNLMLPLFDKKKNDKAENKTEKRRSKHDKPIQWHPNLPAPVHKCMFEEAMDLHISKVKGNHILDAHSRVGYFLFTCNRDMEVRDDVRTFRSSIRSSFNPGYYTEYHKFVAVALHDVFRLVEGREQTLLSCEANAILNRLQLASHESGLPDISISNILTSPIKTGMLETIGQQVCSSYSRILENPGDVYNSTLLERIHSSSLRDDLRLESGNVYMGADFNVVTLESMARSCVTKSELVYCIILILTVQAQGTLQGWIDVIGSSPWTVVLHPETTKAKSTVSIYFPPQLSVSADNVKSD